MNKPLSRVGGGLRPLVSSLLAATLVACGGGGGGGGAFFLPQAQSTRGTVALTTANRDAAAHAIAGGAIGLGGVDQTPPVTGAVGEQVKRVALAKSKGQVETKPVPCSFGGTVTDTFDDRDNNGILSVGDVLTTVYSQCRDRQDTMTNGTSSAVVLAISDTFLQLRITSSQLLLDEGLPTDPAQAHHKTTTDGPMTVDYTIQSAAALTMHVVTEGVTMALQTPVFTDTVKLQSGFDMDFTVDSSVPSPEPGGIPGRTSATMSGRLESSALGGVLVVSTDTELVAYGNDRFPRSGAMRALGSTGTLRLTALSTDQVRIELDANDDGTYEDVHGQSWDWLI